MNNNKSNIQSTTLSDSMKTQYGFLAKRSRIGGRQENQDSSGYLETKHGLLIVVCDGMGGTKGGKTASELAVRNIIEQVNITQLSDADEILTEAIKFSNQVVYQAGRTVPELNGMGTTVTALLIDDKKATAAHVGDSRIYQIRGTKKVFRTFDHSRVFELVKRKSITEEQARLSADSNVILRSLGTKPEIDVEINFNLTYEKEDRFMLCSDGICGAVPEKELIKLIKSDKSVDTTVENIASTIDKLGNDKGGKHDNLTTVLIETNRNSKLKPKMDTKSKTIIGIIISLFLISLIVNVYQITKNNNIRKIINENSNTAILDLRKQLTVSGTTFNAIIAKKDTLIKKKQNDYENLKLMHKTDLIKIQQKVDSIKNLTREITKFKQAKANNNPKSTALNKGITSKNKN